MRKVGRNSVKWKKPPITYGARANTSLPPSVEGPITGYLNVQLLQIKWDFNIPPPAPRLHVRLKWWGEAGAGTIFKVPVVGSSVRPVKSNQLSMSARYLIKANWKKMGAYLNDMGSLILDIGLGDVSNEAMLIGQTVVKHIGRLGLDTPIEEYCEIANADGITLGKIWVKLSLSIAKIEARKQPSTEPCEFLVGPAPTKSIHCNNNSAPKEDGSNTDDSITTNDTLVDKEQEVIQTTSKTTVGKETVSLLLDRSKRLRDAMISSILETEDTIKAAERLYKTKASIPQISPEQNDLALDHQPIESLVTVNRHKHDHKRDVRHDDRIIDLVLQGYKMDQRKSQDCVLDQWSSSDDEHLDDSILTESSIPTDNSGLLQELLYTHKNKIDSSEVVLPAEAFDSDSSSSTSSGDKRDTAEKNVITKALKDDIAATCRKPYNRDAVIDKGLGRRGELKEKNILGSIGLDRLTKLGRVNAARVLVGHVTINKDQATNNNRSTYFVEYRFPVMAKSTHTLTPSQYEVTRVASKKTLNGTIGFSHRSVFPVVFNSVVVKKWWNNVLFFRLYCRSPGERMPQLIGRACLPLRRIMRASHFCLDTLLHIHRMSLEQAASEEYIDEDSLHEIGTMKVCVELLPTSGSVSKESAFDSSLETVPSESDIENGEHTMDLEPGLGTKNAVKQGVSTSSGPPLLQMLLMIPDASNVTLPTSSDQKQPDTIPPNPYLICKTFCCNPHPKTQTIWNSTNPQFSFKQVFPLRLSKSLLVKMCNNFMVIEVWHKTAGSVPDTLVGLVKLSLHQFFLAFSDDDMLPSVLQTEYPVVAVDSYCPIVDPITAKTQGHLGVLLALGSDSQISRITKEFLSGQYSIHRQHYHHYHGNVQHSQSHPVDPIADNENNADTDVVKASSQNIQHIFEIVIEGIRGLSIFMNSVWGEADCFVQYHFPKQLQQTENRTDKDTDQTQSTLSCNDDIQLYPYRTNTALCTPDPSFSHETRHVLTLPMDYPVQKALMTSYRAGGMSVELWKRSYYPNIRDQLVAKATLPTAKLCAVVTMRRTITASIQSFSLPLVLTLKDHHTDTGGLLDLTMKYYNVTSGQSVPAQLPISEVQSQVTLSVGILRAAGLKDAALRACKDSPVSMAFAAEVGVNAYIKLKLPMLSARNEYITKTVARSFAPEFSHFFDVSLPVKLDTHGHTSMVATSLAERLEHTSALLEVWHCMPKHQTTTTSSSDGGHTSHVLLGRRLGGTLQDVLLGSVEIHLNSLLLKHTGISGWFPLVASNIGYDVLPATEQLAGSNCVGGLEMNISFSSAEDRMAILQAGTKLGWTPAVKGIATDTLAVTQAMSTSLLEIHVEGSLLPVELVAMSAKTKERYKLCYVRYKFYDRAPVVSKPYPITSLKENKAFYKIFHSSRAELTNTDTLKWYLVEECLELQLWLCESVKDSNSRPNSRDILVGTASIPLLPLACNEDQPVTIKDSFMLFKAGLNNLYGQCMYVKITITPVNKDHTSNSESDKAMTIMESEDLASGYQSSGPSDDSQDVPSSAKLVTTKEEHVKLPPVPLEEMFEASIAIHQALHVCLPSTFQSGGTVCCFVSMQPHAGLDKVVTPTVMFTSHQMVWEVQALTHIPLNCLSKHFGGLQFHVWCKDIAGREEQIGIVHVDLTPLTSGLRQLCGWYHIVDHTGQPKGQMKLSLVPTSRLVPSKSAPMLSTKVTSDQDEFGDVPDDCTSSFLVNHLRQNIHELDAIHKNLEARLRQLQSTKPTSAPVCQPTNQHSYHFDQSSVCTDQSSLHTDQSSCHSLQTNQSNQHSGNSQLLHDIRSRHIDQHSQVIHGNQVTSRTDQSNSLIHNNHQQTHYPVHNTSEPVTSSHKQEDTVYTLQHTGQSISEHSSSSMDYSSDDESISSSTGSSIHSEVHPIPSTTQQPPHNTIDTHTNITHHSTSSNSSSLSASSDDEELLVEADGPAHSEAVPLNALTRSQDEQTAAMMQSITSNLTTVTPTELSCDSDGEHQSKSEGVEVVVSSSESSEQVEESSTATLVINQPLLDHDDDDDDDERKEQQQSVITGLRDITNSLSQSPPMTSQVDHAIPSSSHSTLQQSPPKRFGLGNAPPKIHLPNFFLPPQELEQTMRQLKMTALTRPPPRGLDHTSVSDKHKESQQPNMVSEKTRPDLSLQDMQRVARIFASKPS